MAMILHLDLDSFFASCERERRPEIGDVPVVVCVYSGRGGDSGAVSAADYSARDFGIHAGMPIVRAKKIAEESGEDMEFLPADKEYYGEVSSRIMEIIESRADDIEVASIDEAYADLSSLEGYGEAKKRAEDIKEEVEAREGITASVGIGPNKFVAKMASDFEKPDGMTVVEEEEVEEFLAGMEVEDIHGVGPKTRDKLMDMGVESVEDLQEMESHELVREFGEKKGTELYRKAHGEGDAELSHEDVKQISRLTTLRENTRELPEMVPVLRKLAGEVDERVRKKGFRYSSVTTIVITSEIDTRTKSRTLEAPVESGERLAETARELLEEFLEENPGVSVRRLGVRASNFSEQDQQTIEDFVQK